MSDSKPPQPGSRRMPKDSLLYEKIVPLVLIVLGLLLVLVMVAALAAVAGLIRL
jgi:hypothetical protein